MESPVSSKDWRLSDSVEESGRLGCCKKKDHTLVLGEEEWLGVDRGNYVKEFEVEEWDWIEVCARLG